MRGDALYIQRGHDLFIRDRTSRRERRRKRAREGERDCVRSGEEGGRECRLPNYATCPFGARGPFLEE